MLEFNFRAKYEIVGEHDCVKTHVLDMDKKKSTSKKPSLNDNLIIHGDNLIGLKSLLPYYAHKIKCIYIDPPYNTGHEDFIYNDNINSPTASKMLGPVGKENADLNRHDKWLCMMYPRLKLMRELLSDDGLIFISIDDNELYHLKLIMDEIFSEENYRNTIIVKRGTSNIQSQFDSIQKIKSGYESILVYSKSASYKIPKQFSGNKMEHGEWNNHWRSTDRHTLRYELLGIKPDAGTWRWEQTRSKNAIKNYNRMKKELKFLKKEITPENIDAWYIEEIKKTGLKKIDLLRMSEHGKPEHFIPPNRLALLTDVWMDISSNGSRKLKTLIGTDEFDNPKSVEMLKRILQINTADGDIILDSFAGSGTTGHAVLELNNNENVNRKFILIECEDYIEKITLKRIKKALLEISDKKSTFTFCRIGKSITLGGMLSGKSLPSYAALASHIVQTSTGDVINTSSKMQQKDWKIHETSENIYFLIYDNKQKFLLSNNSALDDKTANQISKICRNKKKRGIVFSTSKKLTHKTLYELDLQHCQIPFDIRGV